MNDRYLRPWHRINLSTEKAISANFNTNNFKPKPSDPIGLWQFNGDEMFEVINKDWLDYVADSLLLPIDQALLFYRPPNLIFPEAHTDVGQVGRRPKSWGMNFIINQDDDSHMVWYDVPEETATLSPKLVGKGEGYAFWPLEDVKDKESHRLTIGKQLTLVNIKKAHNVYVGEKARWSVSFRFQIPPEIYEWEPAVDYFSKFMVRE
jgi:hypothetical protein